jgi:carbon storage regulator CsrA
MVLVITRKEGESVKLGSLISVRVSIVRGRAKLFIEAPRALRIARDEFNDDSLLNPKATFDELCDLSHQLHEMLKEVNSQITAMGPQ